MVDKALPEYRQLGYASAQAGKRFYLTPQDPEETVVGEVGFDETTPTLIIENPATNRLIIRSVIVTNLTNKVVNVSVVLDSVTRFSSGGVDVPAQNVDSGSSETTGATLIKRNATATTSGATVSVLRTDQIIGTPGEKVELLFEDCIIMDGLSSLLIYIWDGMGVTGPDTFFFMDLEAEVITNPRGRSRRVRYRLGKRRRQRHG